MASVISAAILRTQTDERLVALARAGHKRAFEAIAERYRGELSRAVRRILPSGSVEDALQQTNLQAWQALSGGREVRELRAWLHRIARNTAIAAASRGYDYDELTDALLVTPGPEEDLERRDAVRRALRGIAELPERQREALLAVAVEGRSHAELGLDLGITDIAARQLVRRARVSLIGLMSVATPPQLLVWAARAGHTALAGKAAAGKAAAGKAAAGTGLGGGLGGSALKIGAIAVTVGGVAAGVPPIRQELIPSRPPAAVHRHQAPRRTAQPSYVAAAAITPVASTPTGGQPASAGAAAAARRRHAVRKPHSLVGGSTGASGPPVVAAPAGTAPTPSPASPATGGVVPPVQSAASTVVQSAAALLAWWLAHHHQSSAASQTTSTGGGSMSQAQGGASGVSSSTVGNPKSPACDPTGPTGPTGASPSPQPSSSTLGSGSGSGSVWAAWRESAMTRSGQSGAGGSATSSPSPPGAPWDQGAREAAGSSTCDTSGAGSAGRPGG